MTNNACFCERGQRKILVNYDKRQFFFSSRRRHTRWNCDWSSDVCSSDLDARALQRENARHLVNQLRVAEKRPGLSREARAHLADSRDTLEEALKRSEERRVGKECNTQCAADHDEQRMLLRTRTAQDTGELRQASVFFFKQKTAYEVEL